MNEEQLRSKFAGALLGTFVGDAVGAPVEGWPPDRLAAALDKLAGLPARGPQRDARRQQHDPRAPTSRRPPFPHERHAAREEEHPLGAGARGGRRPATCRSG